MSCRYIRASLRGKCFLIDKINIWICIPLYPSFIVNKEHHGICFVMVNYSAMIWELCFQVTVFKQPNYLENFVQSTFNALPADKVKGW